MIDPAKINIPYDRDLTVAANELFLRATLNRNLEKLIDNDVYLKSLIDNYGSGDNFSLQAFKEDYEYKAGDIVIFPELSEDGKTIEEVYLLKSLTNNNTNKPSYEIVEGFVKDFTKSNWEELNSFFSTYKSNDGKNLYVLAETAISSGFNLSHETNVDLHKFGAINENTITEKVLKKDFSNLADSRKKIFWSYETKKVEGKGFSGYYKKWGNGVIEYDLTYSLGGEPNVEKIISPEDGSIVEVNYMKINSLVPLDNEEVTNDDYFLAKDDYLIFNKAGSTTRYSSPFVMQTNTTSIVNEYHRKIVFPIPFIDTNYMIFTSDRTNSNNGRPASLNSVTFLNRRKESITALLAVPNYNKVTLTDLLLRDGSFQCQIIGRWK